MDWGNTIRERLKCGTTTNSLAISAIESKHGGSTASIAQECCIILPRIRSPRVSSIPHTPACHQSGAARSLRRLISRMSFINHANTVRFLGMAGRTKACRPSVIRITVLTPISAVCATDMRKMASWCDGSGHSQTVVSGATGVLAGVIMGLQDRPRSTECRTNPVQSAPR